MTNQEWFKRAIRQSWQPLHDIDPDWILSEFDRDFLRSLNISPL